MTKKFLLTILSFVASAIMVYSQEAPAESTEDSSQKEPEIKQTITIYRWGYANSVNMPDFGSGVIHARKATKDESVFWIKTGGKWQALDIKPRQTDTFTYQGPQKLRLYVLKEGAADHTKDENFQQASSVDLPGTSSSFILMIRRGETARLFPMNISPETLPKEKLAVINMTRQRVALSINGATGIVSGGAHAIFSPKKKQNSITCQIAKFVKNKWVPCYKNILTIPENSRTILLVYDPYNKTTPRYNVQVLNLR